MTIAGFRMDRYMGLMCEPSPLEMKTLWPYQSLYFHCLAQQGFLMSVNKMITCTYDGGPTMSYTCLQLLKEFYG